MVHFFCCQAAPETRGAVVGLIRCPPPPPAPLYKVRPCISYRWSRLRRVWTIHDRDSAAFTVLANSVFLPVGYRG